MPKNSKSSWLSGHNPFLLVFSIFWFFAFLSLGVWQITRGLEKQQELSVIHDRPAPITSMRELQEELIVNPETSTKNLFFQPVRLRGSFRNQHFLLDNSIYYDMVGVDTEGQAQQHADPYCLLLGDCGARTGRVRVGYRIFSVFLPSESVQPVLVERGWLEGEAERNRLPRLDTSGLASVGFIEGVVMPQAGKRRALREDVLKTGSAVQLVQTLDFPKFGQELGLNLYPYPIILAGNSPGATAVFAPLPNFSNIGPARHFSYSFQWFLMAAVLLTIYIIFYRKTKNEKKRKN